MARLPRRPLPAGDTGSGTFVVAAGAVLVVTGFLLLSAWNPSLLPVLLGLGLLACVAVAAVRFTPAVCALWLLVAATSPDMWLADIIDPASDGLIAAAVKLAGLALVVACALRYGPRLDVVNPGFAFAVMFIAGLAHGLYPVLSLGESLRSLIGSAAPYAFSFARQSRAWCRAMIAATIWAAPAVVALGGALSVLGLRDMLREGEGVLRLAGSTHPAFLGGFALAGVYACLVELWRDGRGRHLAMLVVNFGIIAASGARAPLLCGAVVVGLSFAFLRSEAFGASRRVLPFLAGAMCLPLVIALASQGSSLRLLNVLGGNAESLSGRDVIWPYFETAWDASPWFGWGVGAGKVVVDPDSTVATLLGTNAAHNEYLRIGVDGGYFGLAVLIAMMAVWCWRWTRGIRASERVILRLVFLMFAVHSITDNTLIAGTASVLFAWVSAVFARGALEAEQDGTRPKASGTRFGAPPRRRRS